ncbi:hypothetical protein MRX96_056309 [Rhipicephalus microplus]
MVIKDAAHVCLREAAGKCGHSRLQHAMREATAGENSILRAWFSNRRSRSWSARLALTVASAIHCLSTLRFSGERKLSFSESLLLSGTHGGNSIEASMASLSHWL